jgi:hypothetical protein
MSTHIASKVKFGRRVEFDERSRGYPVRTLLRGEPRKPRSYTWRVPVHLDQKAEGACVGFAWSHELAARPVEVGGITDATARKVYWAAQKLDPWPGEEYEGTSVLAGAKAVQALHPGKMLEYRWAFDLNDVLRTVSYFGPVVLGIPWYESMSTPNAGGWVYPLNHVAGGHAILCHGVNVKEKSVKLWNSWGPQWGINGGCKMTWADLEFLLNQDGEACVPVKRLK